MQRNQVQALLALAFGIYEAFALLRAKPTVTYYVRKTKSHRLGKPVVYFAIGWWASHFLAT